MLGGFIAWYTRPIRWEPLSCDTAATHFPIATAWHAGENEIRFYASPRIQVFGLGTRRFANVQLVAFGAYGCGPRYVFRRLSTAEMAQAARDWVAKQIGIQ